MFGAHDTLATGRKAGEPLWIFRGQSNYAWPLKTKLERELQAADVKPQKFCYFEEGLVREFQRRLVAAEDEIIVPKSDNIVEWMALMQHHGAPTRLLDWSYSFFVALFFAIESAQGDAALYAINARWCNEQSREKLPLAKAAKKAISEDPYFTTSATFRSVFARNPPIPLVYRINTFFLNARLAIQQGLFLCPGMLEKSFEENLEALQPPSASSGKPVLYKLKICRSLHKDALMELSYMNIGRHSLFPGLDGFAQSLQQYLKHSDRLYPPWQQKRGGHPFSHWLQWTEWTDKSSGSD